MSRAKEELMRREHLYAAAQSVLLEAGAASECPHGELLSNDDPEADKLAFAIGTKRLKAGLVDGTREEFMQAIKSAMDDTNGECPSCRKIEDE
jgi:hypothetical protein